MIDWKRSAELNGMSEDKLRARFVRFPHSNKKIVAVCDECGKVRELSWGDYNSLCLKCSVNTPEALEKNRLSTVEYFSHPENREKHSKMKKRAIEDDPSTMDAIHTGHDKYFADPANLKKLSDKKKQLRIDNPEIGREHSAWLIQYYNDNPEARKRISDTRKSSDACKAVTERQVGGYDIVGHHMIYDHSDLSKNIMYMTRSMHMRLHRLFQKHGIEIPHINNGG